MQQAILESHPRKAQMERETRETRVVLELELDNPGNIKVKTGIAFLDHMLESFAFYADLSLSLSVVGDLEVDDHHTSEDCALLLGQALRQCMGKKEGLARFGYAYAPLDESLARCVVDLSGRPHANVALYLKREMVGTWATENVTHFVQTLAMASMSTIHVDVLRGENDHHKIEATFKALGLSMKEALTQTSKMRVPSLKGVL